MPIRSVLTALFLLSLALPDATGSEIDASGVPVPAAVSKRDSFHDFSLMEDLTGRWSGAGTAVYPDGTIEALRCVAIYIRERSLAEMHQNIRCKGENMELKLGGNWAVKNGTIAGTWTEDTYSLAGKLNGAAVPSGFDVKATSTFADASVSVRMAGCRQDITITFSQQVDHMQMALRKC